MKKIITILSILVLTFACSTQRELPTLSEYDFEAFNFTQGYITYNTDTVARLSGYEIAYDNGVLVDEVTFVLDNPKDYKMAYAIIAYVHSKRPNWDIEVQVEYNKEKLNN